MATMRLRDGYDRSKAPRHLTFELMTADEARALTPGARVWFLANDGTARQCTINGRPKTWKRAPGRIEVPIKYGLYEYGRDEADDLGRMRRLLRFVGVDGE